MSREMRHSGVEWIGDIPVGWKIATLKQIGTYINGYAFKPEDWTSTGKPIIRIQDLTGSLTTPNYYNGELDSKYLVAEGDILVSWAATLDAFIWKKEEGWLNQHIFKALPSSDIFYQYFYWLIKVAMENMNNDNKHGIVMQHVTTKVFGNFAVTIPTLEEQKRIANYLDMVCSDIDEMVALQEQMIEELKAYKQSLITEAVTKGLNPNTSMRNSSVDWIGEIPNSWQTTKIKMIAKTNSGSTPKTISNGEDSNIIWFRTTDINDNVVSDSSLHLTIEEFSSASCPMLDKGTCVVAMYGGGGTIGKSGFLSVSSTINQALCSMEVVEGYDAKYLFFVLRAVRHYWMKYAVGTRKDPNINQEIVRNLTIPYPSIKEQQEIASYLDEKCSEIDSMLVIKQAKIDELEEYKKSIIYEYVTGKREVPYGD